MRSLLAALTGCALAYVMGSFPSAYLAGRAVKGIDLRKVGSGNLGATNVYRELGAIAAILVLLLDAAKGAVPAAVFPGVFAPGTAPSAPGSPLADLAPATWGVIFGAFAILGHAKPVFLLWKGGGKGVATAAGVFAAVAPSALAASFAIFVLVVAATRFVSLASIVAAIALPVSVWWLSGPSTMFGITIAVAAFVVWTHRMNIGRLMRGVEPKIGRPGSSSR